jgi:hypothetical protein
MNFLYHVWTSAGRLHRVEGIFRLLHSHVWAKTSAGMLTGIVLMALLPSLGFFVAWWLCSNDKYLKRQKRQPGGVCFFFYTQVSQKSLLVHTSLYK